VRSIIVRYPRRLCKSLGTGTSLHTTIPGWDVPPPGTCVPMPLPLVHRDPAPSSAAYTCGPLPSRRLNAPMNHDALGYLRLRGSWARLAHTYWRNGCVPTGEMGAYLLEKWCVPTGETGAYLLEKRVRTYWRNGAYLLEKEHTVTACFFNHCSPLTSKRLKKDTPTVWNHATGSWRDMP
jgi:hypothetical protein